MKFSVLLLTFFLFFSCTSSKEVSTQEIIINTFQKGELYGAGEEGFQQSVHKITSVEEWHSLVKKLSKINIFETDFDAHTFNFEENALYFCADKVRNSGGFSLSVSNGKLIENKVIVEIKIHTPLDAAVEVLTQPFILFSMERRDNVEIQFVQE